MHIHTYIYTYVCTRAATIHIEISYVMCHGSLRMSRYEHMSQYEILFYVTLPKIEYKHKMLT